MYVCVYACSFFCLIYITCFFSLFSHSAVIYVLFYFFLLLSHFFRAIKGQKDDKVVRRRVEQQNHISKIIMVKYSNIYHTHKRSEQQKKKFLRFHLRKRHFSHLQGVFTTQQKKKEYENNIKRNKNSSSYKGKAKFANKRRVKSNTAKEPQQEKKKVFSAIY
jgi:hypothetical protein